jgi:hypothetical protein
MDPERWQKVDNLLQSVLRQPLGRREGFLRQACGGDEALEAEVQSLLTAQQEAGSFLESPAIEVAARELAREQGQNAQEKIGSLIGQTISHYRMELKPGAKLGPYEILSRIGAGGMGQVWKARDTRLDRVVAIKISAAKFSERFAHEARAIAALNHPHICTLHDVGPDYLVMEFVDAPSRS